MEKTDYLEEGKKELIELIKKINDVTPIVRLTVIVSDYLEKRAIS